MKKSNFISLILGLCLSVLLIMPVYADPLSEVYKPENEGADVQPLDEQTFQQEFENFMQDSIFAFGPFPSFSVSNVDCFSFVPAKGDCRYDFIAIAGGTGLGRHLVQGPPCGVAYAPIENVPTGAVIFAMGIEVYDASNTGSINVWLLECDSPSGNCTVRGSIDTGIAATPGRTRIEVFLSTPIQVFNALRTYYFGLSENDTSTSTTFRVARLAWSRMISPAPASATFNDVGTGAWYFQGVEALAAANITQGCNPPTNNLFCPNANVTRAQMAVFLARALGLHWPG